MEKAARAVKDSDEFVAHIFNIARGFQAHHDLDVGMGARGVRRSLNELTKHATRLLQWLERSDARGAPEHEALSTIEATLPNLGLPLIDPALPRTWLGNAVKAGARAQVQLQGKKLSNAPRFAATALRATFEHHGLKVSHRSTAQKESDAIKLLCAIAKDGGDATVTATQAREWLIESARSARPAR